MQAATSIDHIRNLGIMAHIDAGKTTTTERMLYYAGVSRRMGEVHDGASVMDWMAQEQERGISITAASTSFLWNLEDEGYHCNLIDTPGHIDFTVEVERSLRVLDGAVAIFCAASGVEPQSETVWRQADRYGIPRIAFINKCDRSGADPEKVAEEIRQKLKANPIVVQMPHALEAEFNGIVDLVHFRSRTWDRASLGLRYEDSEVPEDLVEEATLARNIMLEALAEVDDSVMEMYLAETEISAADIVSALRRATLAMRAVPVVMGAALKNQGVQNLLDAVCEYLPSPADVGGAKGHNPATGKAEERAVSIDEPLAALAFKVMSDPKVGTVTYLRVYSGVLKEESDLFNANRGESERVGRLVRMHARHRERVEALRAGDIGAAVGLSKSTTGDTLCAKEAPIVLDHIKIPAPVAGLVLESETGDDDDALSEALLRISAEDPSLTVRLDPASGRSMIQGMGELHLDIVVDRLKREFGVEVRAGRPEVAYRETVTEEAEYTYLLEREASGGAGGQYAGLTVGVAPVEGDLLKVLIDIEAGPDIPKHCVSAIESGLREALETGVLAAFPVGGVSFTVKKLDYHPVDSSDIAFKIAALRAARGALEKASPALLEPVMEVEVVVPDDHVGDVVSDLHARRGKIAGIEARHGVQVIACLVPLAKMFGYASDLRSRTKGRATYSMQLNTYKSVPSGIRENVVSRVSGA